MSAHCQNCHRQELNAFLCQSCTNQLATMLNHVAWLISELDNRISKLDRIGVGTVGRSRRADELDVMDFDAADTARQVRKTLLGWVETVAERHSGRIPPGMGTVATRDLARWLEANVDAIAHLDLAVKNRHPLYDDIAHLAGTPDDLQGGQLVRAINPQEKRLVGPCPTPVGRDRDGTPRTCDTTLFADTYDKTTQCPECHQAIDVEDTRKQAAASRDLHTRNDLLELLDSINEPVTETRIDLWIGARRLRIEGYKHDGDQVEYRLHPNDEPLYSVKRARYLRMRDDNLRTRQRRRATA